MERFIDPKTLARVKDLPLVAKTVAEGFLYGIQQSMQRGVGIEFSQYRAYETGDELSRIDWKLFARSDRYFVREAERESEIDIWFLLDSSRSMAQKSQLDKRASIDKLTYAKILIASLSYLAQKQGDTVGFLGLSEGQVNYLPSGNGLKQWQRLLVELEEIEASNKFPQLDKMRNYLDKLNRPSIIFLLSDFSQVNNEILDVLSKLNTSRSEVVAMQIYCEDEVQFDFKGPVRFKDLETSEEVLVSASNAKSSYQKVRNRYIRSLEESLKSRNIYSYQLNTDQPLDYALFEYLKQRQKVLR
ncbi:MAG: DUF58 domain-containing protein [Kangiellaceae bacterium]|nr:DUF58 domain-containing protein [Kangiellaceae bacterium]MCW8999804.1 DUF58 domain-containing protein [Kangiellaceae bacterium]MCW9018493.1 DUF58 domain-containing protein [Kangiellaceae bacterium]